MGYMIYTYYLVKEELLHMSYCRLFLIDRRHLAYLKFIIEGYDGLALVSTVDRKAPLVKITSTSSLATELDLLLRALSEDIPMSEFNPLPASDTAGTGEYHA
jgi:hypothetical protein